MFDDITNGLMGAWKKNGPGEWYYTGHMDIRLCERTCMIYDLYYLSSNKINTVKVIVGKTDDVAKDKAEDFLKKNNII